MARTDTFTGLSEFLAVADRTSFRAAAADLGVTPAAISQAIRALEKRIGLPLFQRTTRRVSLTEPGMKLLARLKPAATEIVESLDALGDLRVSPSGLLRLSVPRMAIPLVLEPLLPEFHRAYPEVEVEIDVDDAAVDLTAKRFDAGIRIGEFVDQDMVAVKITPDIHWSVIGSAAYFAVHGRPKRPEDLINHVCVRFRFPTSQQIYRWEFERDNREFSIEPRGPFIVNDSALQSYLAVAGVGLAYTSDLAVASELADGRLERVLERFLPKTPGLFLYFPARSQTQPKLRVFIDAARALMKRSSAKGGTPISVL
jgi:DNA-binding transcriptional LysR family regulator